jgi:Co/Zn/Cd efflux system component
MAISAVDSTTAVVMRWSPIAAMVEGADPARLAADMARSAQLRVHGEFVLARGDTLGNLADLTDGDVERWTLWLEVDAQERRRR